MGVRWLRGEWPGGVLVMERLGDGRAGSRGVGDGRRNLAHRDAV